MIQVNADDDVPDFVKVSAVEAASFARRGLDQAARWSRYHLRDLRISRSRLLGVLATNGDPSVPWTVPSFKERNEEFDLAREVIEQAQKPIS